MEDKVKTFQEALNVLIQSANLGQTKGIYSLRDARLIADSIDILTPYLHEEKSEDSLKIVKKIPQISS